jgi:predicted nucleic acid-binding Zn ribbon protein
MSKKGQSRIHQGSPIAEVLKDFIQQNNLQKGIDRAQIKDIWEQVMGPAVHKYTQDIQLQGNKLIVKLSSSVLREELSYGKTQIMQILNEALGKDLIQDIFLV